MSCRQKEIYKGSVLNSCQFSLLGFSFVITPPGKTSHDIQRFALEPLVLHMFSPT
jgi:hypothetical protein